ncbi:hypothetical protein IP81_01140 [Novosphingobium sp. AAP83]|uniref:hypothetical protein n=1 Tax=Novosphingobium sp. AAP83 TaxID=1523425 RepID=UPI0006B8D72D|nr:hypothetical protein IP81_01140 [Novosphingobium sp. AAP83]
MPLSDRSQARSTALSGPEPVPVPSVLAYTPPSARELRAQAVHRLQVGMFGLAGMLLIVSLANVIMDRAKYLDETAVNVTEPLASASEAKGSETKASDPLVDMGVAPELPVSGNDQPKPSATPASPRQSAPAGKAPNR